MCAGIVPACSAPATAVGVGRVLVGEGKVVVGVGSVELKRRAAMLVLRPVVGAN